MAGVSFVFGLLTGWKLTSPSRGEETIPPTYNRERSPSPPPSTPIIIIPHRPTPTPSVPIKPKATKPSPPPEISITPSNISTPPQTPPQAEQRLFRVTIGPMEEQEAKKLQENLAKEGRQTFLIPADGKYKLQLGAFVKKENAEQLADELKGAGYNPVIEER